MCDPETHLWIARDLIARLLPKYPEDAQEMTDFIENINLCLDRKDHLIVCPKSMSFDDAVELYGSGDATGEVFDKFWYFYLGAEFGG